MFGRKHVSRMPSREIYDSIGALLSLSVRKCLCLLNNDWDNWKYRRYRLDSRRGDVIIGISLSD